MHNTVWHSVTAGQVLLPSYYVHEVVALSWYLRSSVAKTLSRYPWTFTLPSQFHVKKSMAETTEVPVPVFTSALKTPQIMQSSTIDRAAMV